MDAQRAETLARAVRRRGIWDAHARDGRVHIHTSEPGGSMHVVLCERGTSLHDIQQVSGRTGVVWAGEASRRLAALDRMRLQYC